MSWTGVITNAGQALLDQWAAGGHTMTIDRAAVGSGVTSLADLLTATNLAHYEAAASIIKVEAVAGGTRFKIQVSPSASEAYQATEIGIWAHIDSEASVLMALHQDTEGGVAVPTQSQTPDFAFALYCIHAISNTSELTVNIDPSAFVSNSVFTEAVESLDRTKLAKTGDSKDNVTGFTSGDEADTAVTYDEGWSTVPALASGLKHSALFNRISTMMKNVRFLWKLIGDTDISGLSSQHTVTGALSKLNTDIIPHSVPITDAIIPLYVTKVRAILFIRALYVAPTTNIAAGIWTTIGTLPDGYRPLSQTQYIGEAFTDGTANVYGFRGQITTSGELAGQFDKDVTTSTNLFGTIITFTLAD